MEKIHDIVIIGGGPAGLSAGIYASRAELDTVIIEKGLHGGQAATTHEIENYPGVRKISGPDLVEEMRQQAEDFDTKFVMGDVVDIRLDGKIKEIDLGNKIIKSKAIVIATGAKPKVLGFEGEVEFTGRGVGYCATCDGRFYKGLHIFVIGGSYSAVEEAMYLARFGRKVTIVARRDRLTCAKSIVKKLDKFPNIDLMLNTEIKQVEGDYTLKKAKFYNNFKDEYIDYTPVEDTFGVFVFVGYKPATDLFKGKLEMDNNGYILTDEHMRTSVEGVWAAGDLRPKVLRQVVTAVADGAIASVDAEKYLDDLED